jgi:uncharacterized tellurite resistance protein B-like protein
MNLFQIHPESHHAALRALRTVSLADGKEAELERRLLDVAARTYGAGEVDFAALGPITPEELAAAVRDPADRLRVVQGCLVMGLADGEADRTESSVISAFARALGVDEKRLSVFGKLASGARLRARIDFTRNSMLAAMRPVIERQGKAWFLKMMLLRAVGTREDSDLAWRYRRLGLLPEHTLGRQYWAHMRERRFAFPGEIGGAPEFAVQHDITHVLTGFNTEADGEMQIAAFTAGMKREDPFTMMFFALLQFHAGLQIQPVVPAATGTFDPAEFARAHERGSRMKIDLTDGTWDHWPHMDRAADDVRIDLGLSG